MGIGPIIVATARKHGIKDNEMLHAYRNPVRVFGLDDLGTLIGADESGRLLEVGVVATDDVEIIVHAMPARPRFLR